MSAPTRRTAVVTASVAAAVIATAGPAAALWVRPASAAATSAGGAVNGCVSSAEPLVVGRYGSGTRPPESVQLPVAVTCPAAADVRKVTVALSLLRVLPDGSTETLLAHAEVARIAGATAPVTTFGASSFAACDRIGGSGPHDLLVRTLVKTKTSASDTDPYVAKADRRQTVTCA